MRVKQIPFSVRKRLEEAPATCEGPSNSSCSKKKAPTCSPKPISQQRDLSLPLYERYQAQVKGRAPYLCIPCDRPLARSTLTTHVKNLHGVKKRRGDKHRVDCVICGEQFTGTDIALEHVTQYHK